MGAGWEVFIGFYLVLRRGGGAEIERTGADIKGVISRICKMHTQSRSLKEEARRNRGAIDFILSLTMQAERASASHQRAGAGQRSSQQNVRSRLFASRVCGKKLDTIERNWRMNRITCCLVRSVQFGLSWLLWIKISYIKARNHEHTHAYGDDDVSHLGNVGNFCRQGDCSAGQTCASCTVVV